MDILTNTVLNSHYRIGPVLLRCRFSTFYQTQTLPDGEPATIRRVHLPLNLSEAQSDCALADFREATRRFADFNHPNVAQVKHEVPSDQELLQVLDPLEGRSLGEMAEELSERPSESVLCAWLLQLASGLDYLHSLSPPIIYRDLRPHTVLITPNGRIVLMDYGMATLVEKMVPNYTVFGGISIPVFAAPEHFVSKDATPLMDIYSLGATVYALAACTNPPSAIDRRRRNMAVRPLAEFNPSLSPEFNDLVMRMMALDPEARPQQVSEVSGWVQQRFGNLPTRPVPSPPPAPMVPVVARPAPALPRPAAPLAKEAPTPAPVKPAPPPPLARADAPARPFKARKDPWHFQLKLPWFSKTEEVQVPFGVDPTEDDLARFPWVDLATLPLDRETARLIPETISKSTAGVCIGQPSDTELTLVVADPTQIHIYDNVSYLTGGTCKPILMRGDSLLIELAHEFVYSSAPGLQMVTWFEWLEKKKYEADSVSVVAADSVTHGDGEEIKGPVIEAVDRIIKEAVSVQASDIHIETFEHQIVVRYRMDGILHVINTWPRQDAAAFVKRIKIMANMDISQDRIPQGGRISLRLADREFDLRVSCLPVPYGESVVLRILNAGSFSLKLDDLGLVDRNLEVYHKLISQPHGMLLISGPTGSGKSTTLYASLATINGPERKILTVEDPIEFKMEGIVQVQVNLAPREEDKRVTFAGSLREFLRHDPDVILVGEIRDDETAAISVQAALTGHLLLSTIHTNSAFGIITRLNDRGIEPFLMANTLIGGVAQRLVRKICKSCREEVAVPRSQLEEFAREGVPNPRMFTGRGCTVCHQTGYRGRMGIYEVFQMDAWLREAIVSGANSDALQKYACANGMRTLKEDGLRRVAEGLVSLEEVKRVCLSV